MKKMYEKKVHFYRYQIVIDILLIMHGKKVHFYHYRIDINCYRYHYQYVTNFIDNSKSELLFCPIHIFTIKQYIISGFELGICALCWYFPNLFCVPIV
jgi:hypothetical protein